MCTQPLLLEMPDRGEETTTAEPEQSPAPRLKEPERNQFVMSGFDLDQLIPANHLARGIWSVVQQLDSDGNSGTPHAFIGLELLPNLANAYCVLRNYLRLNDACDRLTRITRPNGAQTYITYVNPTWVIT